MEKQKKETNGRFKLHYLLLVCVLLLIGFLVVGFVQYMRLRTSGDLEAVEALDDVCKTYDIEVLDFKSRWISFVIFYASTEADTPAGNVEYFRVKLSQDRDITEELQLSTEEDSEFSDLVWETTGEYRSSMTARGISGSLTTSDLTAPQSPYHWRLLETPSGRHLAIWYEEEFRPDEVHLLSW